DAVRSQLRCPPRLRTLNASDDHAGAKPRRNLPDRHTRGSGGRPGPVRAVDLRDWIRRAWVVLKLMESTSEPDRRTEHHRSEGSHVEHGPAGSVVEHPTADDFGQARVLPEDPTSYKHAVFYEVLVRAFYDSNADGIG